ncbi:MFS transporter [Rhodococcus sp. T2V]|uniref:MFS transporter n=1 Tax=Rhodococcus sp. T2V TaxID=3034164 RepID=UPI0023E0E76C|nr:MFS transporter [Rhodococcus sp. T2V]MDF3313157.1 MFS transporter [Rhodococcus sp. T2V]
MTAPSQARRAGFAAFFGTSVEWYDFFIYGTASALILGKVFFPDLNPTAGILASFATFGVGYLARPLGGVIFGHLGDRIGRKKSLVATLLMMGIATVGIGLLPTYGAIGIAAPIALVALRVVQGIAVGGEWGGAVLIASEHAQKDRRVSAGAWAQQGAPAGNIMAAVAFLLVGLLPVEQFEAWGWRLPFLASGILVVIGLVIRSGIDESPDFVKAVKDKATVKLPVAEVIRKMPLLILLGAAAGAATNSAGTFAHVFGLNWATTDLGMSRQSMLTAILIMSIVQFVVQPFGAVLAARFEPIRVFQVCMVAAVPLTPFAYLMVGTANTWLAGIGLATLIIPLCCAYAIIAGFLAEAFPAHVRYTAISLSYQITAVVLVSGIPMISQFLLTSTGTIWSVIAYQLAYVVLAVVAATVLSRRTGAGTRHGELRAHNAPSTEHTTV